MHIYIKGEKTQHLLIKLGCKLSNLEYHYTIKTLQYNILSN